MMTPQTVGALVYLVAGAAIVYLFQVRRKKLGQLRAGDITGLDKEGFAELQLLLKTAYERMLYLGVLFFPLAYASHRDDAAASKLFFLILLLLLFLSNIPPRIKIMRLLERYNLSSKDLLAQGIRL